MDSVKDFWIGLGDFWTSFENRSEIEDFWEGMFGAFENLLFKKRSSRHIFYTYFKSIRDGAISDREF